MQSSRKLAALLVVVLAILALGPAPAARAGSAQPYVYPPQSHPYGHSYSEWLIRFVRWWMAAPTPENPVLDHTGAHCAVGQSGPAWYLTSNEGGTDIRTCAVPAGKALLIFPAGDESATVIGGGDTFEALRSTAKGAYVGTEADVTVDGVHLTNLLTRYRFETPLFTFAYPADNYMGVPGPGTTKAVADGILVMLAPLAAGRHTVDLRFSYPPVSMRGHVTYHLTVRR
jgi:hypothetical protein